ncbi:MAG: hypothetical protein IJN53_05750 [Oscillospiraceae bacterium]|nr:hypothetical protein [Oscillospiraceae bacterium]
MAKGKTLAKNRRPYIDTLSFSLGYLGFKKNRWVFWVNPILRSLFSVNPFLRLHFSLSKTTHGLRRVFQSSPLLRPGDNNRAAPQY